MKKSCFKGCFCSKAFTLIELLVVVLIIGILAAVALPQYKISVAKSKTSTILPLLKNVTEAENTYFLANGQYADDPRDLDVELPANCSMIDNSVRKWACDNNFIIYVNTNYSVTASYCPGHTATLSDCVANRDFYIRFSFFIAPNDVDSTQIRWQTNERLCWPIGDSSLGKAVCAALGF